MAMETTRAVGDPTATREEIRMGGSLMSGEPARQRPHPARLGEDVVDGVAGRGDAIARSANWSATKRSKETCSFMPIAP